METPNTKHQTPVPVGLKRELLVIVNGAAVTLSSMLSLFETTPLYMVRDAALFETNYDHLPAAFWEIKDSGGNILDGNTRLGDHLLPDGKLFVSLRAGVGA